MADAADSSENAPPERPLVLMLSCEHGGREVPPEHVARFALHGPLLDSHRGWDPGALLLARELAERFEAPLYAATTTRLLIDLNRSIGHRQLYSEVTRDLPRRERAEIAARWYRPYRDSVEQAIAARIAEGARVLHVASHSFTPVLHGAERRADVAWLYDPRRAGESAFARRWQAALAQAAPELRLRRNHPYRGAADGLAQTLRRRHPDAHYLGLELEVNQRFVERGGAAWDAVRDAIGRSLAQALRPNATGAVTAAGR